MDKAEYDILRRQALAEKEQLYQAEPDVAAWVKKKGLIFKVVAGYWILHAALLAALMMQMDSMDGFGMEIFKLLFQLLWIWVFMAPEGSWRLSVILYFSALMNFATLLQYPGGFASILDCIREMSLLGVVMLMESLVPVLLLGIAIYLTAIPRHRELSERAEAISKETAEKIKKYMNQ